MPCDALSVWDVAKVGMFLGLTKKKGRKFVGKKPELYEMLSGEYEMPKGRCYIDSAIRSLRPMRLKIVMVLSSLRMRRVRRISLRVEPLVVTSSMTSTFCWRMAAQSCSSAGEEKRRK